MKIDDAVLNSGKIEFRFIEFGDVFSVDEEFYIKCNLNPCLLSLFYKINKNNNNDFECAVNIYDGFVTAFELTTMVRPIKTKLTLEKQP